MTLKIIVYGAIVFLILMTWWTEGFNGFFENGKFYLKGVEIPSSVKVLAWQR